MAQYICHKDTDKPIKAGDIVQTMQGPRTVLAWHFGFHGARVVMVDDDRIHMASECNCYSTTRD